MADLMIKTSSCGLSGFGVRFRVLGSHDNFAGKKETQEADWKLPVFHLIPKLWQVLQDKMPDLRSGVITLRVCSGFPRKHQSEPRVNDLLD